MAPDLPARLMAIYNKLFAQFGPQHWWPGETPFEVCVGAILTQNTAWTNVEKAIANLKTAGVLHPATLRALPDDELAELIRPSGYFNLKARRLKGFLNFLGDEFGDSLEKMFREPTATLRPRLLAVHGIGPETADSILLYAGGHSTFVVDAYTLRIFTRLGLVPEGTGYHAMQAVFEDNLPQSAALYNEYHALIVTLGKDFCRPRGPRCGGCGVAEGCGYPMAGSA
ncbi:MAG: endonuclease III domain-containing protein [Nitrospirae bacterium]|nr:endonuclease III domain-containing protein [Nitrospirota bacterium]